MKMKKILSLFLAMTLMLTMLAGCGGTGGDSTGETGTGEEAIKIGYILIGGGLGDQASNDDQYAGLTRFSEEFGAEVKYVEITELQDIDAAIRNYADQGMNLTGLHFNPGARPFLT